MATKKTEKTVDPEDVDAVEDAAASAEMPPEEEKSYLDKLTDLRTEITGDSAVTQLIDILIDTEGGDSKQLAADRAEAAQNEVDANDRSAYDEFRSRSVPMSGSTHDL